RGCWKDTPGGGGPEGAAADADDVHVVVFASLSRGKVVMNQSGTGARNFVGADRGPDAAAAHGDSALDGARRDRLGERDDEVRIVVVGAQLVRSEVDHIVSGGAQTRGQVLLQLQSPVIGRDSQVHVCLLRYVFSVPMDQGP